MRPLVDGAQSESFTQSPGAESQVPHACTGCTSESQDSDVEQSLWLEQHRFDWQSVLGHSAGVARNARQPLNVEPQKHPVQKSATHSGRARQATASSPAQDPSLTVPPSGKPNSAPPSGRF